MCLILNVWNL